MGMKIWSTKEDWKRTGFRALSIFSTLFALALIRSFREHGLPFDSSSPWLTENGVFATVFLLVLGICIYLRRWSSKSVRLTPEGRLYLRTFLNSVPISIRALEGAAVLIAVLAATLETSEGIYSLLHAFISVCCVFCVAVIDRRDHILWAFLFVLIAVIFCPLVHLGLEQEQWTIIDWLAAVILGVFACLCVTRTEPKLMSENRHS